MNGRGANPRNKRPATIATARATKTVLTDAGKLARSIPRDQQRRFEPQLIAKYQRRFPGLDEKIIALYARGMSTRDIQAHLRELYGTEISPELVSAVTDTVLDEVPSGRTGRWNRCMRSCSSIACG
jgi:transposase-like protein